MFSIAGKLFASRSAASKLNSLATVAIRHSSTTVYPSSSLVRQETVSAKEVPVITYTSDPLPTVTATAGSGPSNAIETTLPVKSAVPRVLDAALLASLPATLKRFTLQGKVAVITGGARGLGYNMAQALAEVGVKAIAILDVRQDLGDAAAAQLHEQCGIPVSAFAVDVRDGDAVAKVVTNIAHAFGSLDVLINAAGIADSNIKAEEYDATNFRRLIDINVTGSFLVAQACGRAMIQAGNGGSIIFIASMSGSVVNYPQEQSCYNASKAAVIQLGKSLAAEWATHRIRVNCISPGYMDTALNKIPALDAQKRIWTSKTPQQRLGEPHELNNLAVFLASDGSSFMTGANCIIDGGYTVY
ncbi:MAG: hypothetical protein M1817_003177 [Caeruleum heppii]|nr:MAG: hypothetical protein M1817_003177 [Caeruleum heppii]